MIFSPTFQAIYQNISDLIRYVWMVELKGFDLYMLKAFEKLKAFL